MRSMCQYKGFELGYCEGWKERSKVVGWRLRHAGERQTVFIWLLQFISLKRTPDKYKYRLQSIALICYGI
jgi:hypothetical protein